MAVQDRALNNWQIIVRLLEADGLVPREITAVKALYDSRQRQERAREDQGQEQSWVL